MKFVILPLPKATNEEDDVVIIAVDAVAKIVGYGPQCRIHMKGDGRTGEPIDLPAREVLRRLKAAGPQ
jgi:hypothetical protein